MPLIEKISTASTNPVFYQKKWREFVRRFQPLEDNPQWHALGEMGVVKKALVVMAHPDDETFSSGLICELVASGAEVRVLCLTRGEGGPAGGVTREKLGGVREGEMRKACDVLGVSRLDFLDHVDPLGTQYRVFAPDVTRGELSEQFSAPFDGVDLVVTHGSSGEYWHPAHLLVFEAAKNFFDQQRDSGPAWMTMMARYPKHPIARVVNWDDETHLRLDVSSHAAKRKEALYCHETQLSVFGRFIGGEAGDFIAMTAMESYSLQRRGNLQITEPADVSEGEGKH